MVRWVIHRKGGKSSSFAEFTLIFFKKIMVNKLLGTENMWMVARWKRGRN